MELPIAIHKEPTSTYGAIVPDVPGCFSWGDTVEDAIRNVREAVYAHVEAMASEGLPIDVKPSRIEQLSKDPEYAGAIWALADIDVAKLDMKPERINISIPRFVLKKIDDYTERRHESRSGFLARRDGADRGRTSLRRPAVPAGALIRSW